jgi:allantoinase
MGGDMKKIGAMAKCAPPLRDLLEHRDLWHRLDEVTTIGSDHSPSPPEMKSEANFFKIWGGISGAQHLLPSLVYKVPHKQLAKLTSENVAQRFGIAQKGGIEIGKDADVTIVDLDDVDLVTAESLHYRHRQSPYVGRKLRGRIVRTILRGQTIYHDGKLPAQPIGRFVRPQL